MIETLHVLGIANSASLNIAVASTSFIVNELYITTSHEPSYAE